MKRWRTPVAKPGQLLARWGRLDGSEDVVFAHGGAGASRGDSHLLHGMFSGRKFRKSNGDESDGYLEEFERRGYDLTTLRFSIEQRRRTDEGEAQ